MLIFSATSTLNAQKLQNRELNIFPQNFEVVHKCIFENNVPQLVISVPAYNYRLGLKAYSGYPGKAVLLWQSERDFRDSITELPHKLPIDVTSQDFALEIRITNSNNQVLFYDINYVNASDPETQIYLTDVNGMPLLSNYLKEDEFFKITHNNEFILNFYLKFYPTSLAPAPPPASKNSSYFNPAAQVHKQQFSVARGRELKLSDEGLYFIQTDSTAKEGVFMGFYGADFPSLSRVADLVLATRYITKNEEYLKMTSASNIKMALDEYWLARNKKETEAKRLISLYYNRMKEANRRFSTVKEGWKSDMGMIYTIFGKPQIVRKFKDKTVWYYSHGNGRNPVEFLFLNYGNQFILDRSSTLREPWNGEIMNWRLGRAN